MNGGSISDRRGLLGRRLVGGQAALLIRRLYERFDDWLHPKRVWPWSRLREADLDQLEYKDEYRFILGNGAFYVSGMEVAAGQAWADTKRRALRVISDWKRKNLERQSLDQTPEK